ncbi:hypothetical protein D4764_08G0007790 [Takifugu flavidus]|uniref:Uncharacterized protein n=1 Tax=Takifugu flavidus TaxID=433684 RepID=A0A5C6MNN7_9TELE|nr:hypothetical protein D4764_08G0007790 [Takifugu flavidus]
MSFLRRVAGLSLRDRVRSSAIREELGVESLLLRVERSQMRWLGHLVRMPPGRLPGEVFRACPSGRRPPGRPRTRWRDYVSRLAWERLGIPPDELEEPDAGGQDGVGWCRGEERRGEEREERRGEERRGEERRGGEEGRGEERRGERGEERRGEERGLKEQQRRQRIV